MARSSSELRTLFGLSAVGLLAVVAVRVFLAQGETGPRDCAQRAASSFPNLWERVGGRRLDADEGYRITTRSRRDPSRTVTLERCREPGPGRLDCVVADGGNVTGLYRGARFDVAPAEVTGWTYLAANRTWTGCDAAPPPGSMDAECPEEARARLDELAAALAADPARAHQLDTADAHHRECRMENGALACAVAGSRPGSGLARGARVAVDPARITEWRFEDGARQVWSCSGTEARLRASR